MMAGLYAIFSLAIVFVFYNQRKGAIALIAAGIVLCLAMFWHHATSILQINW